MIDIVLSNRIILQTNISNRRAIARVRCGTCWTDYFDVIVKGKTKELICEECKAWSQKVEMEG